jgi:hypothetical protein
VTGTLTLGETFAPRRTAHRHLSSSTLNSVQEGSRGNRMGQGEGGGSSGSFRLLRMKCMRRKGAEPAIALALASTARCCNRAAWCSFPSAWMAVAVAWGWEKRLLLRTWSQRRHRRRLNLYTYPQVVQVLRCGSFVPLGGRIKLA